MRQAQNLGDSQTVATQGKLSHVEIYGLYDNDGNLRYIGKANCSVKRFKSHMRDARRRKTPVYCWINSMLEKGLLPTMKVLKITSEESWPIDEKTMIFEARLRGERLLNLADGGDQPKCPIEVRRENGRKSAYLMSEFPYWRMAVKQLACGVRMYEKIGNLEKAKICAVALAKMKNFCRERKAAVNDLMKSRIDERKGLV